MRTIMLLSLCVILHANENALYNRNKTWKNPEVSKILERNTKKLETYYKQVDKQSRERNFIRFNGKKVISHTEYAKISYREMHKYRSYIILSEFYIDSVSRHNQLDGVTVGGILANDAGEKKAQIRYFKFAQRYYSTLHELGKGKKIFSYCAAPYVTSCILIGINEKW
ncbi:hypothetical protein [Helicobacter sp. MIT 14-3879]|uniref:hypothetical protein n=1 Tax=Helicobacter sp. MIT 14-3879 TaxID=2040649 RepID=UPI000E1F0D87|nr:hypothetical protein [Helicobacter sp. MIT 14-3879]RDU62210.1 hypothetical protein CQA44_07375 [Helicobacter sp. MIT 14-3879]